MPQWRDSAAKLEEHVRDESAPRDSHAVADERLGVPGEPYPENPQSPT